MLVTLPAQLALLASLDPLASPSRESPVTAKVPKLPSPLASCSLHMKKPEIDSSLKKVWGQKKCSRIVISLLSKSSSENCISSTWVNFSRFKLISDRMFTTYLTYPSLSVLSTCILSPNRKVQLQTLSGRWQTYCTWADGRTQIEAPRWAPFSLNRAIHLCNTLQCHIISLSYYLHFT